MGKKLLLVIPVAVIAFSIAPFALNDSWNSACACIPVNQTFGHDAEMDWRNLFTDDDAEARVSRAFANRFLPGSDMTRVRDHFSFVYGRAQCDSAKAAPVWSCKVWLEHKDRQERGYEMKFQVSPDDKVAGVSAKKIFRPMT
jgi:hypothetical protein